MKMNVILIVVGSVLLAVGVFRSIAERKREAQNVVRFEKPSQKPFVYNIDMDSLNHAGDAQKDESPVPEPEPADVKPNQASISQDNPQAQFETGKVEGEQQTINRKGTFSRVMSPIFLKPTEYASNNGIRELHRQRVLLRKMSLILISSCLKNLTADSSIIGSSANTAQAFTARGSGLRITSSQDTNLFSAAPNVRLLSLWV